MKPFRPLAELPDLPSCNPSNNLLELMPVPGAQAQMLDALRVIAAISSSIPLWLDRQGIKCRLSDGSRRQLFLDVEFNRILFYIYHQQHSPLEIEIANSRLFVSALTRRHNSKKYIHLQIPKSNNNTSQLQIGKDLSLNLKSCKPIAHVENRIESVNVPAETPAASFRINRQELVDAIQDIRSIADECLYVVKSDHIVLKASGPSGTYEHPISSCWNRCDDRAYRILNLGIILRCLKASKCETVWITEHTAGFLKVKFPLGLAVEVNLYAAIQRVEHAILS